jgi:electron transport complex protein RnfE
VYFLAALALEGIFGPSQLVSVGIYLPLLVMEPLVIKRYENPRHERVITSVKKGLITTMGYWIVLFLLAALREFLGQGTLWGAVIAKTPLLPLAAMPAGGFILLGLLVAVWRVLVSIFREKIEKGVEELQ